MKRSFYPVNNHVINSTNRLISTMFKHLTGDEKVKPIIDIFSSYSFFSQNHKKPCDYDNIVTFSIMRDEKKAIVV